MFVVTFNKDLVLLTIIVHFYYTLIVQIEVVCDSLNSREQLQIVSRKLLCSQLFTSVQLWFDMMAGQTVCERVQLVEALRILENEKQFNLLKGNRPD